MTIMNIQEVCNYLGIKRTSFYNYKKLGLPVHNLPSGKPFCYKEEIDEWMNNRLEEKKDETIR